MPTPHCHTLSSHPGSSVTEHGRSPCDGVYWTGSHWAVCLDHADGETVEPVETYIYGSEQSAREARENHLAGRPVTHW